MDEVKIGIIGLGGFGLLHLDVLANLPGVKVMALASRNETRARELAARYRVPHIFPDTDEMLAQVKLDAVDVVTEDTRHLAPTLSALRAGMDVFVEKPISHDVNEARQMVDEAARLKRKLMVGHILRFDPRCAAIKERIRQGEMGRVATVYGRRNMIRTRRETYSHSNLLYTTGVHDIDLILWYFEGQKPVEVYMKTLAISGHGDDVFWGIITMEDGSLGVVETTWLLPKAVPFGAHILLEVIGTEGTALAEVPGNSLSFWFDDGVQVPDTAYWPSVHGVTVGALRDEILYFIRCLIEDRPVEMPRPEEAVASLEVAAALIRSSQEGRPIRL
ncbi:MAG: Gfo/Idh/MocA family oxidoreductase [Anaerolineae bacterium]|nr:Gfo/Idh/MocA family oxidoreductase [Anaerolineae bacterium]